jgi:hypothetical protein
MSLIFELNISQLVIQLENLESRFQNGERSIKLGVEAQQIARKANNARSLQQNWQQEILKRAQHIIEQCRK